MNDPCPFCRIVRGDEPAAVVFEDALYLAFLDNRPLFPGHCLLIPKQHYETLHDTPREITAGLMLPVELVARAVVQAMSADGTFLAMNNSVSQSVAHLHMHIVPRRHGDGLHGFFWPRQRYASSDEMHATGAAIKTAVEQLQHAQRGNAQ